MECLHTAHHNIIMYYYHRFELKQHRFLVPTIKVTNREMKADKNNHDIFFLNSFNFFRYIFRYSLVFQTV